MNAGFWHVNFWPDDFWHEDFWQDHGFIVPQVPWHLFFMTEIF